MQQSAPSNLLTPDLIIWSLFLSFEQALCLKSISVLLIYHKMENVLFALDSFIINNFLFSLLLFLSFFFSLSDLDPYDLFFTLFLSWRPNPSPPPVSRSSGFPCLHCLLSVCWASAVLVIEIPCWQPSSGKPMEREGSWCTWHYHVGGRWESVLTACHENNLLPYNLKHTSFHSHTQPWCRLFITVRENRLW